MFSFFKDVIPGNLIRDSGWLIVGLGSRVLFQFFSFILLARYFGTEGFGALASTLAISTLLAPFVDLGSVNLIIQDVSRGKSINSAIGKTIVVSFLTFPIGIAVFIIFKFIFLPNLPWVFYIFFGLGELLGVRIAQICFGAHFAGGQYWRNCIYDLLIGITRIILVLFLLNIKGNLNTWGILYFFQTIILSLIFLFAVTKTWGMPTLDFKGYWGRVKMGFDFAVGSSVQTAFNDIDKAMIARLSTLDATGVYSIAFRFINVAFLPLMAFLNAATPRFFKVGAKSFIKARNLGLRIIPITSLYGLLVSGLIYFSAPFLIGLVDEKLIESISALRILCIIPAIQSVFFPLADALTGSGGQNIRTRIQMIGLILNVVLNFIYIPTYGWKAAAFTSIFCQIVILVLIVLYSFRELPSKMVYSLKK